MPDIDELARGLNQVFKDMYTGDGKDAPSVMTRLDRLEQAVSDMKQVKWLAVGILLTAVVNMILSRFNVHF